MADEIDYFPANYNATFLPDNPEGTGLTVPRQSWVYIGPNLPGGQLKYNTLLHGTCEEVQEALAEVLTDWPEVAELTVNLDRLASARRDLQEKRGDIWTAEKQLEARIQAEQANNP